MSKVKIRDNLVEMFLKCLRNIQNKGKDELKKIQEKNRLKTENLISILQVFNGKSTFRLITTSRSRVYYNTRGDN